MRAQILPESNCQFTHLSRSAIKDAYNNNETITGYVKDILIDQEALLVELGNGIFGILPFSEVTIYPFTYKSTPLFKNIPVQVYTLLSRNVRVKVSDIEGNRITLSRKANMYEALEHLYTCTTVRFNILSLGKTVAFGDIGDGIVACLRAKDVCKSRIRNISEYFHKGDTIWTKIIDSNETKRFLVSYKETFPLYNPDDYFPGDVVEGRICEPIDDKITGYFINIFPNVTGVMDVSYHLPLFHYGQKVECYVREAKSVGLKLKFVRILPNK